MALRRHLKQLLLPRLSPQLQCRGKAYLDKVDPRYDDNNNDRLSTDTYKPYGVKVEEARREYMAKEFVMQRGYPCFEPPNLSSIFTLIPPPSVKSASSDFLAALHKKYEFSYPAFRRWLIKRRHEALLYDQRFIKERHLILGPDLAAAHFILMRHGAVKFAGQDKWIRGNIKDLPNQYDPTYHLEAIDASGMELLYEGYDNLINLKKLKWLSLRNCPEVDDWHMDRLTQYSATLEYLDLGGCPKVTERGVSSLHRLARLRYLVLDNLPKFNFKELTCLLLEETFQRHTPQISGVNYLNPTEEEQQVLPEPTPEEPTKLLLPP